MFRKKLFLSVLTVASVSSVLLRFLEAKTGWDADRLPVAGNPFGTLLILIWILTLVALIVLLRPLSPDTEPGFPESFSTLRSEFLMVPLGGSLLMAVSGFLYFYHYLMRTELYYELSSTTVVIFRIPLCLVLGILHAFLGVSMLLPVLSCKADKESTEPSAIPLMVSCMLALLCTVTYFRDFMSPVLLRHLPELFALVFLVLCLYYLSAFSVHLDRRKQLCFTSALLVVFSITVLADLPSIPSMIFYGGAFLTGLGVLLLNLEEES